MRLNLLSLLSAPLSQGSSALLLLLAASCGAPPANTGPAATVIAIGKQAPPNTKEAEAEGDPNEPVMIPTVSAPLPSWLAPAAEGSLVEDPMGEIEAPSYGARTAVMRTAAGYFAVDDKAGVIGPLKVPAGTSWIGVAGADDALIAATSDGSLHVAKDARAAMRMGGFEKRGSVQNAVAWDAAGGVIAAASGSSVSVSTDEGRTFQSKEIAPKLPVLDVVVRLDGVIAALSSTVAARKTWISRDSGKSWQASAFQPLELTRDGGWIWNGSDACPAVLSKDGRQWTTDASPADTLDGRPSWTSALGLSDISHPAPSGSDRRITAADPPAPPAPRPGKAARGAERPCEAKEARGGFGMLGLLNTSRGVAGCQGALCLRSQAGAEPAATRYRFALFSDAVCSVEDAMIDGTCRAGAPLLYPPTLAKIDQARGAVETSKPPASCARPARVMGAGGMALLLCEGPGDRTLVLVTDESGAWRAEGELPTPPHMLEDLSMASDGTLLLEASPDLAGDPPENGKLTPLLAFVRSPKPLGQPGAWRKLAAPDAVALRALPGGAALVAVAPASADGKRMDLFVSLPGEELRALVAGVAVDRNLLGLEIVNGRIEVLGQPRLEKMTTSFVPVKDTPTPFLVTRGGKLVPAAHPRHDD
jgi:hypothetical protein